MVMPNSTVPVFVLAKPFFGQWFGAYAPQAMTAVELLLAFAYVLCLRLSICDTTELERLIGIAVMDALDACDIPVKLAAAIMAVDESSLRQSLKRDENRLAQLSIYRLARLPLPFWCRFIPQLSKLVVQQNLTHLIEDIRFRKSA